MVHCVALPAPESGTKYGDVTSYEATVSFTCDKGYFLTGSANRTCQADGEWSGNKTVCNRKGLCLLSVL